MKKLVGARTIPVDFHIKVNVGGCHFMCGNEAEAKSCCACNMSRLVLICATPMCPLETWAGRGSETPVMMLLVMAQSLCPVKHNCFSFGSQMGFNSCCHVNLCWKILGMSSLFLLKGEANAAPAWPFPALFQCWRMALSQKPLPSMLVAQQLVGSERSAGSLKVHGSMRRGLASFMALVVVLCSLR